MKPAQATGVYKRVIDADMLPASRTGLPLFKKSPVMCAYGCGRSVYTIYPVGMCNICRKKRNIPIWNE